MVNMSDLRKTNLVLMEVDSSSSMNRSSFLDGIEQKNIDIATEGIKIAIDEFKDYNSKNVVNKICTDIVSFNSDVMSLYGECVDPEMIGNVHLTAKGVTNFKVLLDYTFKRIATEGTKGAQMHPISIMILTDGQPTDEQGNILSNDAFKELVLTFRTQLEEMNLYGLVDIYVIMAGADRDSDWFKNMQFLCDEEHSKSDRVFVAEDINHAVALLDFVTRYGVCGEEDLHIEQGESGGVFVETMDDYLNDDDLDIVGTND